MKSIDQKKKSLTTELILHFYFPFKVFLENERERDRARARLQSHRIAIAPDLMIGSRSRSHRILRLDRDRDLAFARSHRIEIAVDASRDRAVDRNLAKIAISPSRDRAVVRDLGSRSTVRSSDGVIWVVACVFLNLCFPSSFLNTIKYFPENFLKCNQTP